MGRFRLACHLIQFGGAAREDPEQVLRDVADAGWEGVEGFVVGTPDELIQAATLARRFGLHLVNTSTPALSPIDRVRYNLTLGNDAVEVPVLWRRDWGGADPTDADVARAARSLDNVLTFCEQHRVKGFQHAHVGTLIETQADAERLLQAASSLWLLFDTGHLLAARSDPLQVLRSPFLRNRIGHVHLKDFHADDPATWDHRAMRVGEGSRFAELGRGNFGLDVPPVLAELREIGYQGWISVELDRPWPSTSAAEAARANREYLRTLGY